ncbi:MAG: hypothetical protein ABI772_06650 [Bacteroidota bacterium]
MSNALSSAQLRITALWAFSEAFLGGILHGLHVPFTGLILSSFAAVCMCALALHQFSPGKIIHATILVMIVKLTLSPHTPFTAYFAVLLQGTCCELLFSLKVPYKISCYITALFALMQSAFQKLIVLTILFGVDGWKALDDFLNEVLETFGSVHTSYSIYIISIYLLLHFMSGLIAGRFASQLPQLQPMNVAYKATVAFPSTPSKKKSRWNSFIYYIFFALTAALIYKMYASENFLDWAGSKPMKLIVRSLIIIVFWYFFLSPLLLKLLRRWLTGKKNSLSAETENVLLLLPEMKQIVYYAWLISSQKNGVKRITLFMRNCFRMLLVNPE